MSIKKICAGLGVFIIASVVYVNVNQEAEHSVYVWYMGLPNGLFEMMLDEDQIDIDGQKMHPKMQYHLQTTANPDGKPFSEYLADPKAMAHIRGLADLYWPLRAKKTKDMATELHQLKASDGSDIGLKIYKPQGLYPSGKKPPIMVYFHGGAFIIASVEAVDPFVRLMANRIGAIIVSVDYRLAPEHRFPAAHDDAMAAYRWTQAHAEELGGEKTRILVGGDSAGGNLALSVSHRLVTAGEPAPLMQLLYYPNTDFGMDYKSYQLFKHGFGLDEDIIDAALTAYMPVDKAVPTELLSPINYSSLGQMPPTVIATAGFDPIRDQGLELAEKLKAKNVKVSLLHYPSLIHNFLEYTGVIDDAERAAEETTNLTRQWLSEL